MSACRSDALRRTLAALFLFTAPAAAQAETIRCVYTEPFVNTVFDTRGRTVTVTQAVKPGEEKFRVSVRKGPADLELANRRRAFRQTMVRDGKGSDGMSDMVFPYSATMTLAGLPARLHGGCR
jgi:uncharacterized membrane protein